MSGTDGEAVMLYVRGCCIVIYMCSRITDWGLRGGGEVGTRFRVGSPACEVPWIVVGYYIHDRVVQAWVGGKLGEVPAVIIVWLFHRPRREPWHVLMSPRLLNRGPGIYIHRRTWEGGGGVLIARWDIRVLWNARNAMANTVPVN